MKAVLRYWRRKSKKEQIVFASAVILLLLSFGAGYWIGKTEAEKIPAGEITSTELAEQQAETMVIGEPKKISRQLAKDYVAVPLGKNQTAYFTKEKYDEIISESTAEKKLASLNQAYSYLIIIDKKGDFKKTVAAYKKPVKLNKKETAYLVDDSIVLVQKNNSVETIKSSEPLTKGEALKLSKTTYIKPNSFKQFLIK